MIEIIHSEIGEIKAVLEFYLVDRNGNFLADGSYCWINETYVAPKYRNNGCMRELIRRIIPRVPTAKFGYFGRYKKYPNRPPRIYTREQWLKLSKGG